MMIAKEMKSYSIVYIYNYSEFKDTIQAENLLSAWSVASDLLAMRGLQNARIKAVHEW